MLIVASVMWCAASKLPGTVSDDPTLFISLMSGCLNLASSTFDNLEPELVDEFDNLLTAAAAFIQIHNAYDAQVHSATIRQWLVKLAELSEENSPLLQSGQHIQLLIDAAREGNTIKGLDDVKSLSQLTQWAEDTS
jgi:hypothetical protein